MWGGRGSKGDLSSLLEKAEDPAAGLPQRTQINALLAVDVTQRRLEGPSSKAHIGGIAPLQDGPKWWRCVMAPAVSYWLPQWRRFVMAPAASYWWAFPSSSLETKSPAGRCSVLNLNNMKGIRPSYRTSASTPAAVGFSGTARRA